MWSSTSYADPEDPHLLIIGRAEKPITIDNGKGTGMSIDRIRHTLRKIRDGVQLSTRNQRREENGHVTVAEFIREYRGLLADLDGDRAKRDKAERFFSDTARTGVLRGLDVAEMLDAIYDEHFFLDIDGEWLIFGRVGSAVSSFAATVYRKIGGRRYPLWENGEACEMILRKMVLYTSKEWAHSESAIEEYDLLVKKGVVEEDTEEKLVRVFCPEMTFEEFVFMRNATT